MSDTEPSAIPPAQATCPRPRRRRWVSLLLAILLLLSGGVIGSGLTVMVIIKRAHHRLHHPEEFSADAAARLRQRLDLSDEQTKKVQTILRHRQAALQDLRREFQPRVEAQIDQIRDEVGQVLTPQQAQRWNTWLDEKRRTWLPPPPKPAE